MGVAASVESRMGTRTLGAALLCALALAACDSDESNNATSTVSDSAPPPSISAASPTPATTAVAVPPEDASEWRQFDIDGVEVWSRSALAELPFQATEVEISGTVIDDGQGPVVCLSEVAESNPPQCGGAIVDGLDMGDWATSGDGTRWGERTLTITWPPEDGPGQLIDEASFDSFPRPTTPELTLPPDCEDIENYLPAEQLAAWGAAHPDRAQGTYLVQPGRIGVLRVTGDLDDIRAELTDGTTKPCLEQVDYSSRDLEAARQPLRDILPDIYALGAGIGGYYNQIDIGVRVADRATIQHIVDVVGDPDIVRITGYSAIFAGESEADQ